MTHARWDYRLGVNRSRDRILKAGAAAGHSLAAMAHDGGCDSQDVRSALKTMGLYALWQTRRAEFKASRSKRRVAA